MATKIYGLDPDNLPTFTGTLTLGTTATAGNENIVSKLGTELAPAITQALWTEGAGWTITDLTGIATRVAAASTTLEPTTPIVPDITKRYKIVFTISSWTAGTITSTFGGVTSTPYSGDQVVSTYIDPYTTGNLILTPSADFAGVVSLVSVKEITGGVLTVDGDIHHYDSRGHSNRLAYFTRHVNEMQTDTLLDKSRSLLSCADGVLTYTLLAFFGDGTFNFNGIPYPVEANEVSIALTAGTDAAPQVNYVNFQLVGNTPTLVASTTYPTVSHIDVATWLVGTVSGSSYTIYSYDRNRYEVDLFVKRVIERFEKSGTLYSSGGAPTVTQTGISIASGCEFFNGIFEMTSANTVTLAGFTIIKNGAFTAATSIAETLFYSNGDAVGNHMFANVVWGIVPTTTTAGGTVATTVKLYAILQTKPTAEYTLAQARQDLYEATNYFPSNSAVKNVFVPICRTIVSEDAPTEFKTFDTGLYCKDIRGKITSGGGAAEQTDVSGLVPKTTTITATTPLLIDSTTSADLSANRTISIPAATASVNGYATSVQITKLDGIAAGADVTASNNPKAHTASHAVGGSDAVFPSDPGSDKVLGWDDSESALAWVSGGAGGVPDDGSVTAAKIVQNTAGDTYLLGSLDAERTTASETYTIKKSLKIARGGVLRIKFNLMASSDGTAYGRIYRKRGGSSSAVGTEQSDTTYGYVTKSEDISGWLVGDEVELYLKYVSGSFLAKTQNFRICSNTWMYLTETLTVTDA